MSRTFFQMAIVEAFWSIVGHLLLIVNVSGQISRIPFLYVMDVIRLSGEIKQAKYAEQKRKLGIAV
jgi:hypothetical protein